MQLTPEQVDEIAPDTTEPLGPFETIRTSRWQRHLLFVHYILGEEWLLSFQFALAFKDSPLSVFTMRQIMIDWENEGWLNA